MSNSTNGFTPHAINKDAIIPLKQYCQSRGQAYQGCRYSISKIVKDYRGYGSCIFANCPIDWEE